MALCQEMVTFAEKRETICLSIGNKKAFLGAMGLLLFRVLWIFQIFWGTIYNLTAKIKLLIPFFFQLSFGFNI